MSSIQESVSKEVWDLFLKFMGTGSEFVYQVAHEGNVALKQGGNFVSELLVAIINKKKEMGEPTTVEAQMLKRNEKGETINTMAVAEEEAAGLCKCLNEKGILYNVVDNLNDDTKFVMYMSNDAQKIMDIVSVWQANTGKLNELSSELFLNNFAQEGVGTLSGFDNVDIDVFRDFAKDNKLLFACTESNEPGKYIVIYDPKDAEKVKKTMASTVWALSGKEGRLLREKLREFLLYKQQVNRSLLEPEKEYYIVNRDNVENYVHLTANDFTYYKKGKEISSVDRRSDEFVEKGIRVFKGMSLPILLTREEFERLIKNGQIDREEAQKIVLDKSKNIPDIDRLKEAQKEQNERLERIQSKMALDDENTAGFWIYDNSISFASGGSFENIEDIDEQTKEDLSDACEKAKQYQFLEIENNGLDYLITKAEKQRSENKEQKGREQERDL